MTEITSSDYIIKYAEAILLYLRLKEAEEGPTEVYYKVIADKVMTMIGLTYEEKARTTADKKDPVAQKSVFFSYQLLKYMGLLNNKNRGYWGLTDKGRKSRLYHEDYSEGWGNYRKILKDKKDKNG